MRLPALFCVFSGEGGGGGRLLVTLTGFMSILRVQNRDYPHFWPVEGGCKTTFFSLFPRCFADLPRKMCLPYLYVVVFGGLFCYKLVSKAVSDLWNDFSAWGFKLKLKMMLSHFSLVFFFRCG